MIRDIKLLLTTFHVDQTVNMGLKQEIGLRTLRLNKWEKNWEFYYNYLVYDAMIPTIADRYFVTVVCQPCVLEYYKAYYWQAFM